MDTGNQQNGHQESPQDSKVYVRFGALPTQEMPREWAEKMLTRWREGNPAQFGKILAQIVNDLR